MDDEITLDGRLLHRVPIAFPTQRGRRASSPGVVGKPDAVTSLPAVGAERAAWLLLVVPAWAVVLLLGGRRSRELTMFTWIVAGRFHVTADPLLDQLSMKKA